MSPTYIYLLHAAYWGSFVLWCVLRRREQERRVGTATAVATTPVAPGPAAAVGVPAPRSSRADVWLRVQMVAFFALYFGLGHDVFGAARGFEPAYLFPPLRGLGAGLVAADLALVAWTMWVFRSWRVRAEITSGHELVTGGPFGWVRHPIYLSLDVLVIATFLWSPSVLVLAGALLLVVAGDLRARAEEKLLVDVFGEEYRLYLERVKRSVPGLY